MTNKHQTAALEKEFELERVILFSDAVFAIAITLLIIDIKLPEIPEKLAGLNVSHILQPLLFSFFTFALSFFFIGLSWSVHLRLFRLLKRYDQGLIKRNLVFLFFIVTFPFTASGLANVVAYSRIGSSIPLYLYIANLTFVSVAHFLLCHYITRTKPWLSVEGHTEEKRYIYRRGMYIAIAWLCASTVIILASLIFPGRTDYIGYSCIPAGFFVNFANRKAKKFEPVEHS